jgi:hypothetical protein
VRQGDVLGPFVDAMAPPRRPQDRQLPMTSIQPAVAEKDRPERGPSLLGVRMTDEDPEQHVGTRPTIVAASLQ